MVLKCKLQSSVRPALVEKATDKALFGYFFQGVTLFNTSQLFVIFSFLGLLGLIVWLAQSSNNEESEETSSTSKSEKKSSVELAENTEQDEEEFSKTKSLSSSPLKSPSLSSGKYIIDTIYESSFETHVDELTNLTNETFSQVFRTIETKQQQLQDVNQANQDEFELFKYKRQHQAEEAENEENTDEKKVPIMLEENMQPAELPILIQQHQEEVKKSILYQMSQQQKSFDSPNMISGSSLNRPIRSLPTEGSDEINDEMINKIVDDLICDEKEEFAYNKHRQLTQTQESTLQSSPEQYESSTSSKATIKEVDTDTVSLHSRNSLLELYNAKHIHAIEDHFKSLEEVSNAIQSAGLENSQLIFGIDFTISNLENGTRTFNGRSLHYNDDEIKNPYQKVIEILGKTLECFDVDGRIPAFGFGDANTKDRKVFPFSAAGYCNGFKDVLRKYNRILKDVKLSGPTNFAPLIKEAIKIVKETRQYHILVIVADGQVTNERQTRDAIVEASKYALSIIMVGVGDGPWDTMNEFDDSLPKRQFDNFQFVNYHQVTEDADSPDELFALHALMEIPDQYKAIKELGLLRRY